MRRYMSNTFTLRYLSTSKMDIIYSVTGVKRAHEICHLYKCSAVYCAVTESEALRAQILKEDSRQSREDREHMPYFRIVVFQSRNLRQHFSVLVLEKLICVIEIINEN